MALARRGQHHLAVHGAERGEGLVGLAQPVGELADQLLAGIGVEAFGAFGLDQRQRAGDVPLAPPDQRLAIVHGGAVGVVRAASNDHAINIDVDLSSIPFVGYDPFAATRKQGNARRMTGWL